MKSKEEIEQLVYGCFGEKEWANVSTNAKLSLIETYTQCQVDMAKEIEKYKLFKSKILTAYNIHQGNIHDLRASLNESLNKQD